MTAHTPQVQSVLRRAAAEAARLGHDYLGTEHVLLGLLSDEHGVAATVLEHLQVDRGALISRVDATVQPGAGQIDLQAMRPFTSRTKRSLELAEEAAIALGHEYIGTEHVLLGLLEERGNLAAQLLNHVGVTYERARGEVMRVLGAPPV
jgi:ATP-dependent Clp protease ATP-binding subunit ClpC